MLAEKLHRPRPGEGRARGVVIGGVIAVEGVIRRVDVDRHDVVHDVRDGLVV